jgi:hypothetical protein
LADGFSIDQLAGLVVQGYWLGLSPVIQELFGRKVQPCRAADPEPLGGGVDASEHLRIEAQADSGRARVVVPQRVNGQHGSSGRGALCWPRRCDAILRVPVLNDGEELRRAPGHLG